MSRRDYPNDRYDDRQSDFSRRPRTERNYEELDVDIRQSRYDGPPPQRRGETMVKERDAETVMTQGRRTERGGPRQPDFLREDYGRNTTAGPLVVREERFEEEDRYSRAPPRRRSQESMRSRAPAQREVKEEIIIRERERDNAGPPYPRSERGSFSEKDEFVYRDRARSRPPPSNRGGYEEEEIDIRIRENDRSSRAPPPRSEFREREVEEITFRRGDGGRPPPPRNEVDREEIDIRIRENDRSTREPPPRQFDEEITFRETVRSPPPREQGRGRREEIDIDIRETTGPPPPRQRSMSRGVMVRKDHEEWLVRRKRTPSPSPPREIEREQIIIRRKERSPSPEPEPPREPTPEPPPPPPIEPIYRPPIIQEVITHHRHIDHGVERARSPTPPPAPAPPSPPPREKEEDLEISIRRQGTRNGRSYDEEISIERDVHETTNDRQVAFRDKSRDVSRDVSRQRSVAPSSSRRYDDDVSTEADYYNRRVANRAYQGEAWNGATKDWGLVDIPPGTQRVEMDGVGGGRQEITWDRYKGERQGRFYTDDRAYDRPYGNGAPAPAPLPPPAPEPAREEDIRISIRESRGDDITPTQRRRTRDRMWTEVTKDLVIKEAIEEKGYEYEETDGFFYVMQYLQYEDVLKLVETTEDIRRERQERIRELALERESYSRPKMLPPPPPQIPPPPRGRYDEQIKETYYDRRRYR